jgi:hypothetical protein
MDDGTPKKLNILPDHFSAPSPTAESSQHDTPSSSQPKDDSSLRVGLIASHGLAET